MVIETLLVQIADVLQAANEADLASGVQTAASTLGFKLFLLRVEVNRPVRDRVQHVISNYPLEWLRIYQERQYGAVDPIVAYCRQNSGAVVWSEHLHTTQSMEFWEALRGFGMGDGVSVSVHGGAGVQSMLSLACDQLLDANTKQTRQVVARATSLATATHVALDRISVPLLLAQAEPKLSQRELECLKWAAVGKSSWEIGEILSIAETTATFHMKNVVRKMKVANRTHAIALGVALGLVY